MIDYITPDNLLYKTFCSNCGCLLKFDYNEILTETFSMNENDKDMHFHYIFCPKCYIKVTDFQTKWEVQEK